MAQFSYEAVGLDGKIKKGNIESDSLEKARSLLRNDGLTVVKIGEASVLNRDININIGKKKLKPRDLSVFCRQFLSILKAGVSMISALEMLTDQTENKKLKEGLKSVKDNVEKGDTLSVAMKKQDGLFPPILLNMIAAGESSGSLEVSLERMSVHFEKDAKIKGMVKKAFMYPIVLIFVMIAVVVVMLTFVIPQFKSMFDDIGSDLPAFTKAALALSDSLQNTWYIWLIGIAVLILAYKLYVSTPNGSRVVAALKLKIPVFGSLSVKTACARFARTLSTLMASGMPLIDSINICAKVLDNVLYKDALVETSRQVERGVSLTTPLEKSGLFPSMVIHMISIGEETGSMEEMLTNVADYYDEEVEMTTQQATALMEPIIIVMMALVVCALIAVIYGPMVQLYSDLG
jgi:type IV pilus assembly protein PilC